MSEVDVNSRVLRSFTDVKRLLHLSLDSEDHVLVADYLNDRILLLTNKLQLQRVLFDTNSQVKLWRPTRLCYNELTSQLYVVHSSSEHERLSNVAHGSVERLWRLLSTNVISVFRLR